MWLYKLTNKMNGMAYIGATRRSSVFWRISAHVSQAKQGKTTLIAQAIREFGIAAFIVETLAQAKNSDELSQMEMAAIREHGTLFPTGYNRTIGGEKPGPKSGHHPEVPRPHRKKRPLHGFHLSKEHRAKLSNAHLGMKASAETCRRISEGKRGRTHAPISKAARKRISSSLKGHSVSEETRRKISASLKARKGEIDEKAN